MRSVADDFRREIAERVRAMSVSQRIALSLSLGDDDLARYMRAAGLERAEALRRLRAQRASGRRLSGAAEPR